ncbi:response regulator transcription factor [soil metagenome]
MTILVADDDPLTRDAVADCLRSEGFTVIEATDGISALAAWERARPNLLCLDIMMPGADGYEVCRRVRRDDSQVPVLFLSAKSEEVDVVVGLELGADDFLRKPFGKHELVARVRAALRRTRARGGQRRTFPMGSAQVFPLELRLEALGGSCELTPRETRILEALWKRAGEAVPRDTLLDECWGLDYFPESRTLDQHIAKLRKKLEATGHPPAIEIETIRGVGYRYRPS